MKERDLVDIVAITCNAEAVEKPEEDTEWEWRHGWMHPQTYAEVLHTPPWINIDIPLQLNGIGENVRFGLIDVFENLTPAHWNIWRSLS